MIIGTAGHIDHGKTTLVRALTGVDTDRLPEEKRRGISIELGYAYLRADDGITLGFVDVPGHERLLHTMLAGATGIDHALLVVAADDGVMPQTREHLAVMALLVAAQGFGAAVGNIVCPHNIVAGAATVGLAGREDEILRRTLLPCVVYLLLGGALVAWMAARAGPALT